MNVALNFEWKRVSNYEAQILLSELLILNLICSGNKNEIINVLKEYIYTCDLAITASNMSCVLLVIKENLFFFLENLLFIQKPLSIIDTLFPAQSKLWC